MFGKHVVVKNANRLESNCNIPCTLVSSNMKTRILNTRILLLIIILMIFLKKCVFLFTCFTSHDFSPQVLLGNAHDRETADKDCPGHLKEWNAGN